MCLVRAVAIYVDHSCYRPTVKYLCSPYKLNYVQSYVELTKQVPASDEFLFSRRLDNDQYVIYDYLIKRRHSYTVLAPAMGNSCTYKSSPIVDPSAILHAYRMDGEESDIDELTIKARKFHALVASLEALK